MSGITQTIPNYHGGISEQPDFKKNLGQVNNILNGVPDITYGLYKRPGSLRINTADISDGDRSHSTNEGTLKGVSSTASYFHYYRDEDEGSYIGHVNTTNGEVKIWRCSDGKRMDISWGSTNSATQTKLKTYLTSSDLDFLTINDTTIVTNKNKTITKAGTTQSSTANYTAFVELLKTENGRQYALNITDNSDNVRSYTTATRIRISSTATGVNDRPAQGAPNTGHCPGIGSEVFVCNSGSKANLIFRLTVRGQQGQSTSYDTSTDDGATSHTTADYGCSYIEDLVLLHGGRGWSTGDTFLVTVSGYRYEIKVVQHETVRYSADLNSVASDGLCRPMPTPFDSDTAVTAATILGGIREEVNPMSRLSAEIIGNGLYIESVYPFNVQIIENDLMKVITNTANDISELPTQCRHGYIVKINNSNESEEDDYYLRFEGDGGTDGKGTWVECPEPGINSRFTYDCMPLSIQRTDANTFTVDRIDWAERIVGDDTTNPYPSFIDQTISKILFWRNRLVILSGENVICSQSGDFYNFWNTTALAVSPKDRIDIACSSSFPSKLVDGIQINNGLLVFSTDQQFLLTTDDSILTPETAKLSSVATYNYNKNASPISLGKTIGFLDSSGKYSKFFEAANIASVGEPDIVNQSKVVPQLLDKDINLIANSRENGLVLFGKKASDTVIGYKYINVGNERIQSSWFKWQLPTGIKHHFIVGDEYYFLDDKDYLQKINLVFSDDDPNESLLDTTYQTHLDNNIELSGGVYDSTTRKTTWTNQDWLGYNPANGVLVLSGINGKYFTEPTIDGTTLTADGSWTGSINAGYSFNYQVDFPRFYISKREGEFTVGDVNSSLVLHRIKIAFGKVGRYQSTLTRVGKDDFTDTYESNPADEYLATRSPLLAEDIRTIPVYEKNTNVDLTIKSTHPAPATIRSVSFEGDYSPMFYRSV